MARKAALIGQRVAIFPLGDCKGRIAHAEVDAVAVALLRVADAIRAHRIAVVDGRTQQDVGGRLVSQAHAGRGEGIGWAAIRQVGGHDGGPAIGAADGQRMEGREEEFSICGELAETHGKLVAQLLFDPDFVEPRRRQRLEVGHRLNCLEKMARQAQAMNLVGADMEQRAFPAEGLVEIPLEHAFETAHVGRAASRAARSRAEQILLVVEDEGYAAIVEPRTQSAERAQRLRQRRGDRRLRQARMQLVFLSMNRPARQANQCAKKRRAGVANISERLDHAKRSLDAGQRDRMTQAFRYIRRPSQRHRAKMELLEFRRAPQRTHLRLAEAFSSARLSIND